ncbi:CHAT domain-containing protein [Planomonospora parontospora subsp. parontospora]|uniref:CHAT domain-containing protein n=2 Tax=Planomonospora parontospora TaxID=58119 RepID=A0AA37F447_9ACTN|nr:CHAT domain-containing protein [Planomonospora parontospora]GGK63921.1 CHAT domain-containing protein [Planomonospora parontospora]GII08152.1 CHAT domain-containing protein [Planomonospora parontospora subsp. parontospora]
MTAVPLGPPAVPDTAMDTATDAVAAAERAVRLSGSDPGRARALARAVLDAGAREEAAAVAHRALALAARELGDLHLAEEHLRRAERIALSAGLPHRAAQARLSLVHVRTELGHPAEALTIATAAEPYLTPVEAGRLGVNRASALVRLGRYDEAVRHCDRAEGVLGEDPAFLAGATLNRGLARVYLGEFAAAEADLTRSAGLAGAAGLHHVLALAEGNLPFLAARRGDLPAAFTAYRRAERILSDYPERLATVRCDLAEALVSAQLPGEARVLLDQAVPELEAAGAETALAEARLMLARVELATGDPRRALRSAEAARAGLIRQERALLVPLTTEIALRARLELGEAADPVAGDRLVAEMLACAAGLDGAGHPSAPLRLATAELALRLGDERTAEGLLGLLASSGRGPAAHHATALRRAAAGDRRGALAAARAGLMAGGADAVRSRDPLERVRAARRGEPLAALGLALGLRTGRARTVLAWAERWRAATGGAVGLEGFTGTAGASEDRGPVRTGIADCGDPAGARSVRYGDQSPAGATRGVRRASETGHGAVPGPEELRAALGEAALVEFVRHGDELAVVAVTPDRVLLRRLGSLAAAAEATVRLRYGLRRRHLLDGDAPGLTAEAAAVERLLLGPLLPRLGDRPLVIVPAGPLHTLPWPVLPSNADRPVTVAPSASAWLAAWRAVPPGGGTGGGTAAVAGPGLRCAEAEVRMVAARRPGTELVPAARRTVLAALERAGVAHLAAHGTFSARSPLLSGIDLDDGRLMAYDLLRIRTPPELVVLSACDAGMAHAPADGTPLGLAGAFLSSGTRCVVAGLVPVRDDETLALMTVFHGLLAAGRPPAAALAAAAGRTGTAGFACFGYGDQPVATGREGSATQLDQDPT